MQLCVFSLCQILWWSRRRLSESTHSCKVIFLFLGSPRIHTADTPLISFACCHWTVPVRIQTVKYRGPLSPAPTLLHYHTWIYKHIPEEYKYWTNEQNKKNQNKCWWKNITHQLFLTIYLMCGLGREVWRLPTGSGADYGNQTWRVYTECKAP